MSSLAMSYPHTITDTRRDITPRRARTNGSGLASEDLRRDLGVGPIVTVEHGRTPRVQITRDLYATSWFLSAAGDVAAFILQEALRGRTFNDDIERCMGEALSLLLRIMDHHSCLPQWTPTVKGGIQLDWHERGVDLEIAFEPGEEGWVVFDDHQDPEGGWDGRVADYETALRTLMRSRLTT